MPILDTQLNIWSTQKQIFERKTEHDSALVVPIKSAQLRCASSTSHNNQQGEVLQNSFLSPQASIGFPHCGQVGGSTGAAHHNDLKSRHEPTFNPQSPYNTTSPNLHCLPFNIYPCFFPALGFHEKTLWLQQNGHIGEFKQWLNNVQWSCWELGAFCLQSLKFCRESKK